MEQRVLVVCWDPAKADDLAGELRDAGYAVTTETADGARAFRLARDEPPAAVVVDLRRRPSHGRAVLDALQDTTATRDIPVLVITADEEAQPVADRLRAILPD